MPNFSWKHFWLIWLGSAVLFGLGVGTYLGLRGALGTESLFLLGIGGLEVGFVVAGLYYLVVVVPAVIRLRFPVEEFREGEEILLPAVAVVHFKTGRPHRFWEGVGGKLFLTNQRVVFLAHPGNIWHYRLFIELEQIARAEDFLLFGGLRGAVRLVLTDGKEELFNFGPVRDLTAERWAAAVLLVRYGAHPEMEAG